MSNELVEFDDDILEFKEIVDANGNRFTG